MPIVHDVIQGSPEWLALRSGVPTASEFDKIITPGGKPSKSADAFLYGLLAEKMMGHPRITAVSPWMERGTEMEAEAVDFYELQRDIETVTVGFITNDEGTIGASPDRLVGHDGLLEIKCPSEAVHVGYLIKKSVDQAYYPQVQGQLWISERKWVDILSFHPEMPPALVRVERDEDFIKLLSAAVLEFSALLEAAASDLAKRGWIKIPADRGSAGAGEATSSKVGAASTQQSSPGNSTEGAYSPSRPGDVGSGSGQAPHDNSVIDKTPTTPAAWQISFYGKIAEFKKKNETVYYRILGAHGYEHANEVPSRAKALEIYEEMKVAINV